LYIAVIAATASLSTCGVVIHDEIPDGQLDGTVTVDWASQDLFIYRPENKPLWFRPDFMSKNERIQPVAMYTDGGSIPRFFWNIPGLSPWGSARRMSSTITFLRSTAAVGLIQ
jgi:hypothetical protein